MSYRVDCFFIFVLLSDSPFSFITIIKVIRPSFVFILLIMGLNLYGQINTFELPAEKNKVTSAFTGYDNLVVIEVMLQDSIPVRLILDSGIEGIIITDRKIVHYYEQNCLRSFKLTAPGTTQTLNACVTPLVKMSLEGLQPMFANLILLQDDIFSLESFIGARVHGLIGMDKFRDMVVTINYDQHNLKFTRPEQMKIPAHAEIIPLILNRGRPYMTARVELDNGEIRDLWLMIDSGANHPLLLETDTLDDYKPLKSLETTIGRGLGGSISGSFVRSGWLMMGNTRLDNIITSLSTDYYEGSQANRNFRNGTLGAGALSRFVVSFDYTNSRLILHKGTKFKSPFEYNMSGVVFDCISADFNIFKVNEVIAGSPGYYAGLLPGDLLIDINNKAAFTLNLGELNAILSHKPGDSIILTINRNGQLMTLKFRLKRLI